MSVIFKIVKSSIYLGIIANIMHLGIHKLQNNFRIYYIFLLQMADEISMNNKLKNCIKTENVSAKMHE